jgi:hypothetical protein
MWHIHSEPRRKIESRAAVKAYPRRPPRSGRGIRFAWAETMAALEVAGGQLASDRPTIPVPAPRESEVRLKVERVPWAAATVDLVLCDLSRDPRSESFCQKAAQNDSPPSTSTVRALK